MKWKYGIKWYEGMRVNWDDVYHLIELGKITFLGMGEYIGMEYNRNVANNIDDTVVYVPKWHKCYAIRRLGVFGRGNQLKMCLSDIYSKQLLYCMAKDVEIVVECDEKNIIKPMNEKLLEMPHTLGNAIKWWGWNTLHDAQGFEQKERSGQIYAWLGELQMLRDCFKKIEEKHPEILNIK